MSEHGMYAHYVHQRCRCDACTLANRERTRELRARKRASREAGNEPSRHGATTYRDYGCRCEECTSAKTAETFRRQSEAWRAGYNAALAEYGIRPMKGLA